MNATYIDYLVQLAFIAGAVLFVVGLHLMNSPATARTGNHLSAAGMITAVVAEAVFAIVGHVPLANWLIILGGLAVGGGLGLRMARTVAMTSMPQLVSLFNAVGGGAAALLALNDFFALNGHRVLAGGAPGLDGWRTLFILADVIVGSVTFTGSLVASAKLMGRLKAQPISISGGRGLTWFTLVCGLSVSIVLICAGIGVVGHDAEPKPRS